MNPWVASAFFVLGWFMGVYMCGILTDSTPELCQLRLDATADTLALVQEYPSCLEYTEVQP